MLHIITGPMFAGKTNELISRIKYYSGEGKDILVFKPSGDTRWDKDKIQSRTGLEWEAISISEVKDISGFLPDEGDCPIIAIDEVHFFQEKSTLSELKWLIGEVPLLIISGLIHNFRGEDFNPIASLVKEATNTLFKGDKCHTKGCPKPSYYTKRLTQSQQLILPGDDDVYSAVCRKCFEWKP